MTRLLTALTALLVLLTGCSGSGDAPRKSSGTTQPPDLRAGTCWTDQQLPQALGERAFADWAERHARGDDDLARAMRDDAAFRQPVDCDKPHSLELYNVVSLSPALERQVEEYADLLDPATRLYRRVRDQVNDRCAAGSAYGKAQRKAGLKVQLGPALGRESGLSVAWDPFPADRWTEGERRFVCTFEQGRPGTLRYADLSSSRVPASARVCVDTPGEFVPCRGPHQAEDIAEMILNTAIEQGDIDRKKALRKGSKGRYVAFSDREYARLDRVCQTLLRMVSTRPQGVTARAYPGSVEQWPTEHGTYVASCFALRPGKPPPRFRGTVFDRP